MSQTKKDPVKIILVDWGQYSLFRQKRMMLTPIHCGLGSLLVNMAKFEPGIPFELTIIINDTQINSYAYLQEAYPFIETIRCRKSNIGFDWGAYNVAYQVLKKQSFHGDIVMMNTGLSGPSHDNWLLKYQSQFYSKPKIGCCSISMASCTFNHQFFFHVQSYFLYTSTQVLSDVFPKNLPGIYTTTKQMAISKGEINFSKQLLKKNYRLTCMMQPDGYYSNKETYTLPLNEIRYKKEYYNMANKL